MNDPGVILIDARGGADAFNRYAQGHIAGAHFVDLETELSSKKPNPADGGRHPLPEPQAYGKLLTSVGITPISVVLVYDDKSGANAAARFWWMMKAAGHEEAYVLDGGWTELVASGLPITTVIPDRNNADEPYVLERWMRPIVGINEVELAADDPESLVIDVREAYRYRGEGEPFDLVAGHIPGAINAPYLQNLKETGSFKNAADLRTEYKPIVSEKRNIIVHCGSGVTACHTILALEHAGINGAKLYVGSWSEWSRNNKPIATGE